MQIFQSDKVTGIVQRELGLIILTHSDETEGPISCGITRTLFLHLYCHPHHHVKGIFIRKSFPWFARRGYPMTHFCLSLQGSAHKISA